MDTNEENKETSISHSEQIRAKLNRWKSHSKVDDKNTIDQFLTKKIEPIENQKKNDTEELKETQVSPCSFKCIESIEVKKEEEKTVEFKQDILGDDNKTVTSYCKNNESTENYFVKPNDKSIKEYKTLEIVGEKSDDEENCSINLENEMNTSSEDENLYVQDTDDNLSKIETSISIEIDSSIAPKGRKCVVVDTNLEQIRQRLKILTTQLTEKQKIKSRFFATIDPSKNQQAENELSKEISKDMFSKMSIVGQFNLGFIITKLDADLFIVDQHATDEKYNFETLQKTTKITSQKLVVPQHLELTAVNEIILKDNINIFQMNGFDFEIQEDANTTQKIKLSMIPMSNNWRFGKEDVDELLFMLQDAPNTLCRPSRVRSMFASRACRKSVMIGTVLNMNDMRKLIDHMGVIEQPWNCPHGRPTMRHLVNLSLLNNNSE